MSYNRLASLLLLGTFVFSCKPTPEKPDTSEVQQRPNIIYILADDLGYAEVGAYGQEKIETPNIDALAKEGMRFTQVVLQEINKLSTRLQKMLSTGIGGMNYLSLD